MGTRRTARPLVTKTVADKMGLRDGMRAFLSGAPESVLDAMEMPGLRVSEELEGEFDYIHLFVRSRDEMDERFPVLKAHLAERGSLWVSWPKGRRLGTDLTLPEVIRIGYTHGLVESKTIGVDETWSAIKFTHPVEGKVYENSYGTLPGSTVE